VKTGSCGLNGGSNSGADLTELAYDSASGKFSGSIITNQCNDFVRSSGRGGNVNCIEQVRRSKEQSGST